MREITKGRSVLRPQAVAKKLGISLVSLWRMRKMEGFPEPRQIPGIRGVGWDSNAIDEWIELHFGTEES